MPYFLAPKMEPFDGLIESRIEQLVSGIDNHAVSSTDHEF